MISGSEASKVPPGWRTQMIRSIGLLVENDTAWLSATWTYPFHRIGGIGGMLKSRIRKSTSTWLAPIVKVSLGPNALRSPDSSHV